MILGRWGPWMFLHGCLSRESLDQIIVLNNANATQKSFWSIGFIRLEYYYRLP
jgi:hypothetical protein